MTEPTDADRARVRQYVADQCPVWEEDFQSGPGAVVALDDVAVVCARLLASERAAAVPDLRARVEAVAEELEADSERAYQRSCGHRDEGSDGQYRAYEDAAERLRAALVAGDPA